MPSMQPHFVTKCFKIDPLSLASYTLKDLKTLPQFQPLRDAAKALTQGDVVAVPTETVYGLAANAYSQEAVQKIYTAKARPADNPLIVHISSLEMLTHIINGKHPTSIRQNQSKMILNRYQTVLDTYWPGPLTVLVPTSDLIPSIVTCQQPTVGIRFPAHPVMRALIELCGFPLAAPSANVSGRPSPTIAKHVMADLDGRIGIVLDGGACDIGIESTVLDGLRDPPAILRPGKVTAEDLVLIPGFENVRTYQSDFIDRHLEENPTTPGMKYRHYSPEAPVILIQRKEVSMESGDQHFVSTVQRLVNETLKEKPGLSIALLTSATKVEGKVEGVDYIQQLGPSVSEVSFHLFRTFRELDQQGVGCILVEGVVEEGEGLALMNRIRKAAGDCIYY